MPDSAPTAQPCCGSMNHSLVHCPATACSRQLVPPSLVTQIALPATTQPCLESTKNTPGHPPLADRIRLVQLAPPSEVLSTCSPWTVLLPTVHPWRRSTKWTP